MVIRRCFRLAAAGEMKMADGPICSICFDLFPLKRAQLSADDMVKIMKKFVKPVSIGAGYFLIVQVILAFLLELLHPKISEEENITNYMLMSITLLISIGIGIWKTVCEYQHISSKKSGGRGMKSKNEE